MNTEPFDFHSDLNNFLLFKQLRAKLGPNCIQQATQAKATESRGNLNEALEKYFKNFIIMDIVSSKRPALSEEKSRRSFHMSSKEAEVVQSHSLHLNPFKVHLQQSGISNELRCQDIDQEYLSKLLNEKKKGESLQLTKEVEAGIKEFCYTLRQYSRHWSVSDGNWINSFKGFVKEQVSNWVSLEEESAISRSNQKSLDDMILTYYKELAEGISMLYNLISLHEEQLQLELHYSQFFSLKSETLHLKMKLIELKVLMGTYTKESISALRVISTKTNERAEQASKEMADKRTVLGAYKILGTNYEQLVAEYSRLMTDINRLKWSIETLEERMKD